MNVLLVNPNCGYQIHLQSAPLGLLSIGTYLKERGYHIRLYDRKIGKLSTKKAVRGFQPDAVGVSVASAADIRDGIRISRWFRARGILVAWGGQFSSLIPEMILREGAADYVVIGEGEITFHELLRAIEKKSEPAQVSGIAYLDPSGTLCLTPAREAADLADFPVIDWSFIDPKKYYVRDTDLARSKVLCIYSSKGCPGNCAFCYSKSFHRSRCRQRPNEYVISEIEELSTKHGMDGIFFVDDNMFGAEKSDLPDFCERLKALGLDLRWHCCANVRQFSREDLRQLYDAGCRRIFCGVESGSPEMLKRMRKEIDLAAVENLFQNCLELGIALVCGIVLGFPGETEEQLRDTARLMKRLNALACRMQILQFYPMPGSDIYSHIMEAGKLTPPKTLKEWGSHEIPGMFNNFTDIPARDLHVVQCYFYWRQFIRRSRKPNEKGVGRREYALDMIVTTVRSILQQKFFIMCAWLFTSVKFFVTITWYAHAYPSVRKKYGLD